MPREIQFSLLIIATALCVSACAAPEAASKLSNITISHVNSLNAELRAFVDASNEGHKSDAARIGGLAVYFRSEGDFALAEARAWRADPTPENRRRSEALDSLQKDALSDMAVTDSLLKQRAATIASLQTALGEASYKPEELRAVITELQTLSAQSAPGAKIKLFYEFGAAVAKDVKAGLATTAPTASGTASSKPTP